MSKRLLRIKRFIHSSSLYRLSFSSSVFVPSREEEEEEEENDDGNETPLSVIKVVFLPSVRQVRARKLERRKRERERERTIIGLDVLVLPSLWHHHFIIVRACSSTT